MRREPIPVAVRIDSIMLGREPGLTVRSTSGASKSHAEPRHRARGRNTRGKTSRRLRLGFSSIAARAGLRVSELNAEMIVEIAIVRANWRKNWPTIPVMNAQGTNTADEHQTDGDHRAGDLVHRPDRGVARA